MVLAFEGGGKIGEERERFREGLNGLSEGLLWVDWFVFGLEEKTATGRVEARGLQGRDKETSGGLKEEEATGGESFKSGGTKPTGGKVDFTGT